MQQNGEMVWIERWHSYEISVETGQLGKQYYLNMENINTDEWPKLACNGLLAGQDP